MENNHAFTLIELLIVVAIIAILAAIAVPNFLEAQTRAKVSRVKSDFRSTDTALNAYLVDWNTFPVNQKRPYITEPGAFFLAWLNQPGSSITTPVAYMTSLPAIDVFAPENVAQNNPNGYFQYFYYGKRQDGFPNAVPWMNLTGYNTSKGYREAFSLVSWGPDREQSNGEHLEFEPPFSFTGSQPPEPYDATNGTISDGDIVRFGGSTRNRFGVSTK